MHDSMMPDTAETIARAFHETYERLAPRFGYKTRRASAVAWADVPGSNRQLMITVTQELLDRGVIDSGQGCRDLSGIDTAAIRARVDTATPGPWVEKVLGSEGYDVLVDDQDHSLRLRYYQRHIARLDRRAWKEDKGNAEFIAHARIDVPLLLDLIESQRAEIQRFTQGRRKMQP